MLFALCLFFIAVLLCLTSCFLNMLVGSFLPRMLTLVVYSIGWACTSPRISVLVGPLEPLLMCSAVVLGGLRHLHEHVLVVAGFAHLRVVGWFGCCGAGGREERGSKAWQQCG